MPVRDRAGSSPVRSSDNRAGPEVLVTAPSVRSNDNRFRRSSVGAVDALKGRPRRDTTTSSDISSENEVGSESPGTRQIHFSSREEIIAPKGDAASDASSEKLEEEGEMEAEMEGSNRDEGWLGESVGSALSSEFGATAGSGSLLNQVRIAGSLDGASSPLGISQRRAAAQSPKKSKVAPPELQALPPPRPISTVESSSALTAMLKARKEKPANPLDSFALLSDKSLTAPLYIKIYVPSSSEPNTPLDMPMVRDSKANGLSSSVMVMEAIGLALWRYVEDGLQPPLEGDKLNVNRWSLRIIEDGEVDYDFPALGRNRPVADFTSNNNRAAAARGRSRSKPYDEFALVEASPTEFRENEKNFPKFSTAAASDAAAEDAESTPLAPTSTQSTTSTTKSTRPQPMLGQPFPSALNDSSLTPADRPAVPTSHATPRMGSTKTLKIRYVDAERSSTRTTTVSTSTDSYIAEILDSVCKRWGLDKGSFTLKVVDTNTAVPPDRTVEALGDITYLDIVRRRFAGGPAPIAGSPVSSSPNAPLLVASGTDSTAKKSKKKDEQMLHPLAQQQDALGGYYRRYHVIRKQSMGLAAPSQRVLVFDHDYMHIMAGETGKTLWETGGKTTSVSFGDVVGSKVSRRHPKSFRVVVLRGNDATEQKRYDFEAKNAVEAVEIVDEIKKNMKQYQI